MKNIPADDVSMDDWIKDNLQRATRYIERYCRRAFFPELESRVFPIPNRYIDLSRRRFTSANLWLDKDLLESTDIVNGNRYSLAEGDDYFLLEHNIQPKFGISLIFPNFWRVEVGSSAFNYDHPEITVTGWWGYHEQWFTDAWLSTYTATPIAGMDNSQIDVTVPDATVLDENGNVAFSEGALLRVEDELTIVNAVNTTTNVITMARGQRGTDAVDHVSGMAIEKYRVHEDITQVCLQVTKLWREYGEAAGGRLGVSEVSVGVEIGIPADPLNILKSYVRKMSGPNL